MIKHKDTVLYSDRRRILFVCGLLMTCASCSDPKAVQTFAGMSPDPAMAEGLTQIYVAEPGWRARLNEGTSVPPDTQAREQTARRQVEAKGILSIDTGIREYMKALGALASDSVVQSSSNVGDLKSGLTSLQKDVPLLGITDADVTLISQFIQALADLAENGYRDAELSKLIGASDEPLQRAIDIQTEIVNRGIIPSINEYNLTIESKRRFLSSQPKAVGYLFDRVLGPDKDNANAELIAARSYVKALTDIKAAHMALYKDRNNVLTKAMFEQIKGPAQEAYKAFQDYQAAAAKSAAK